MGRLSVVPCPKNRIFGPSFVNQERAEKLHELSTRHNPAKPDVQQEKDRGQLGGRAVFLITGCQKKTRRNRSMIQEIEKPLAINTANIEKYKAHTGWLNTRSNFNLGKAFVLFLHI